VARAMERLRHPLRSMASALGPLPAHPWCSAHPELPIIRYGGGLFRPGRTESEDPVERALAVFEDPGQGPSDAVVYGILQLLTRARLRVRQGRSTMSVETAG